MWDAGLTLVQSVSVCPLTGTMQEEDFLILRDISGLLLRSWICVSRAPLHSSHTTKHLIFWKTNTWQTLVCCSEGISMIPEDSSNLLDEKIFNLLHKKKLFNPDSVPNKHGRPKHRMSYPILWQNEKFCYPIRILRVDVIFCYQTE